MMIRLKLVVVMEEYLFVEVRIFGFSDLDEKELPCCYERL